MSIQKHPIKEEKPEIIKKTTFIKNMFKELERKPSG